MICPVCKVDYPAGYLNPIETGAGDSPPVCGICALELLNKATGVRRERFGGAGAERLRQRALRHREVVGMFERGVVSCSAEPGGGFLVKLSCGHEAIFVIEPANSRYPCAECVNEHVERERGR